MFDLRYNWLLSTPAGTDRLFISALIALRDADYRVYEGLINQCLVTPQSPPNDDPIAL